MAYGSLSVPIIDQVPTGPSRIFMIRRQSPIARSSDDEHPAMQNQPKDIEGTGIYREVRSNN